MSRPHRRRFFTARKIGGPHERQSPDWLYRHRLGHAHRLRHQCDSPPKEVNQHWSITYADEALSDEDVAEPEVEEEATEEKLEGNNMAAMAVGAIVIIGVCGFVLYHRKKA